jgi:hypothetical protein
MKTTNNAGHCANCDSENIMYYGTDIDGLMLCYDYSCPECDTSGKEWYELNYVETVSN